MTKTTTMEEKIKAKIRNIYYTGLAQGLHEVDGFDTFAPSWYEELVTLFQETIEQAMPEEKVTHNDYCGIHGSDCACDIFIRNAVRNEIKSNVLEAIGKEKING